MMRSGDEASTSLNVFAVVIATFVSIEAPKMFLLGPEGSAERCLHRLRRHHKRCMAAHVGGLIFFFLAVFDLGFLSYATVDGVFMSLQLIVAVVATFLNIKLVLAEFGDYDEEKICLSLGDNDQVEAQPPATAWAPERDFVNRVKRRASGASQMLRDRLQPAHIRNPLQSSPGPRPKRSSKSSKSSGAGASASGAGAYDSDNRDVVKEKMDAWKRKQAEIDRQKAKALVKSGIANKEARSGIVKNWKPRYFELYRDCLVYYESKGGQKKGTIYLYDRDTKKGGAGDGGSSATATATAATATLPTLSADGPPIDLSADADAVRRLGLGAGAGKTKGHQHQERPFCEVTPTDQLQGSRYRQYASKPNCLQIRTGDEYLYMEMLSLKERNAWAEAILRCSIDSLQAAQERRQRRAARAAEKEREEREVREEAAEEEEKDDGSSNAIDDGDNPAVRFAEPPIDSFYRDEERNLLHSELRLRQKSGKIVCKEDGGRNRFVSYQCELAARTLTISPQAEADGDAAQTTEGTRVLLDVVRVRPWDGKGQFSQYEHAFELETAQGLFQACAPSDALLGMWLSALAAGAGGKGR